MIMCDLRKRFTENAEQFDALMTEMLAENEMLRNALAQCRTAKIQEYRDNGWIFRYEPETRFVGAYHPQGGKQSICELRNGYADDVFGLTIAACLNFV
jgi:hypothetical protein